MKFKVVKPFIEEMLVFIFVIGVVLSTLLFGNYVEIVINMHLFTIIAMLVVFCHFILMFSRIMNIGTKALFDYLFQAIKEDDYVFIKEMPYQASVFSEKFGKNRERSIGMYYLIQLKKKGEIYSIISSSYIDLSEGKTYTIKTGRSSNIFISSTHLL